MNVSQSSHRRTLRILCIEDHPLDREILRRQLEAVEQWGEIIPEVVFAASLGEAVLAAQREQVDVCIVDLLLPDSRGVETLYALRRVVPYAALVVVSSDSDLLTLRQSVYANVHGYLVKGEYTPGALVRSILAAWEHSQLELRLAETTHELHRSQAQYRALLEYLPDAVIMTDAEGKILYLNPAAHVLLGRSGGELIGEELAQLDTVTDTARDIVLPHRDGRLRYAVVRTQRAILEDQEVKLYFLHDITERRLLEHQLLEHQRRELLGILASGIAHDINNLLSPIMLGVQTLLRTVEDERSRRVLAMIEQSARRGAELVRQVLGFARSQDAHREQVAPKDIIAAVIGSYRTHLSPTITLDTSGVDLATPSFYADPTQVVQVLLNLIANAHQALGEQGGTIRLACYRTTSHDPRLSSKGIADAAYVVFEVSDTGHGIPEDIRPRIFEPFFTTRPNATGLGLYTVLAIVKRHEGTLHIESTPGVGTRVSVFFPLTENAAPRRATALVVSPSATLRNLVRAALDGVGLGVIEASSSSEALGTFIRSGNTVDLVVADDDEHVPIDPDKLRTIRELKPSVRVVLLCSLVVQQSLAALEGSVVDAFLPKPCTDQMLLDAVAALMGTTAAHE